MTQNFAEIAKEITIAAIEHSLFTKKKSTTLSTEELNKINAEEISEFYAKIAKGVNDVYNGKFTD
ncbi:hypothetical protein [Paenibacillus popilliae]|uniref:GTPase-activating protein n=1 Tax=Paenibacillus popilliae ATCC 14706 TaxID=1212764 RepID=M9M5W0_PAEPP|nr:hypothetical protein [Paenibacillus popilliae]GAC42768.1 GTPase-activating protein [Paenibacillus popilliae ATCC 14706]